MAGPLSLESDWRESDLLGTAPPDLVRQLTSLPVTVNFHRNCLTPANFSR